MIYSLLNQVSLPGPSLSLSHINLLKFHIPGLHGVHCCCPLMETDPAGQTSRVAPSGHLYPTVQGWQTEALTALKVPAPQGYEERKDPFLAYALQDFSNLLYMFLPLSCYIVRLRNQLV